MLHEPGIIPGFFVVYNLHKMKFRVTTATIFIENSLFL